MGAKLGGGGGGKYKIEQNSDINVTPFVDVMLVLLIIFMVSIPVATVSIKLDLPPAKAPPTGEKKKDPVFISIMGPNDIYIAERKTSLETLDADVRAALQSDDPLNERILVRGWKDIEYRDFVQVLNELQQHGYLKIGLINEDIE
ncbi:ExbD/TolR family protein [Asticcacaulis biprosthecium]|uniref:ExbD/TolR family protein n=1 Tax=Asticcacaulis biprosthecium TaxID=76891 RepID=UPI0002FC2D3B|nr:biopolymer transporter ExbD [Asticcacaulis biprosthecium]